MASTVAENSVSRHARQALTKAVDFIFLKVAAQQASLAKSAVQAAVISIFGLAILVWLEVSVYLALQAAGAPAFAALLTMALNVIALAVINALVVSWKRKNRALLVVAQEKRDAAAHELRETRVELLDLKDNVVARTSGYVHERIVVPIERYKMPVAVGLTFITGVCVARAMFPPSRQSKL